MRFSVGAVIVAITHGCGGEKVAPPQRGSEDPVPKVSAPIAPALHDALGGPQLPKQTSEEAFTGETRDPDWAPKTETEIKRRFGSIRGAKLEGTECRQSQCRLTIAGSEGDVGQSIADLGGPRGLHGYATVVLSKPTKKPDGSVELRIYTVFDR